MERTWSLAVMRLHETVRSMAVLWQSVIVLAAPMD
jgi:uncharacterized membrane protein YhaH (DUF805 family)